jgi:hypothetical protein
LTPRKRSAAMPFLFSTEFEYLRFIAALVEGQPNHDQVSSTLQKLLADRFQLTFHRDKKQLSVYAIVVGKGGTKSTGKLPGIHPKCFAGRIRLAGLNLNGCHSKDRLSIRCHGFRPGQGVPESSIPSPGWRA